MSCALMRQFLPEVGFGYVTHANHLPSTHTTRVTIVSRYAKMHHNNLTISRGGGGGHGLHENT